MSLVQLAQSAPFLKKEFTAAGVVQAQRSPVVLYAKASKTMVHGIKTLEARTQKLADFQVTGGFDVPDHPPGALQAPAGAVAADDLVYRGLDVKCSWLAAGTC